ncbi:MAG: ABC transporter ATP-binding protein [Oscillospiraceae bacterium]|nr:ABC transporter ATP-binding protein [Oscillospiraceae bacterium]
MSIVEVQNVKYIYKNKYQTVNALNGVNCSFEEGHLYALVGKSGSGKSTLLSLLAGLMLPSAGEILFNGQSTAALDLERYRREHAAVIYQSFRLLPMLTVLENVVYPMEIRGFRGEASRARAAELVRKVGLPDSVLDRFPNMLSGGEQQRVAIARAMSMDTRLLLADEPTGNLDTENGSRIIELLLQLAHREGYCVVVVTHDPDISARADVTYRIRDGVLQEEARKRQAEPPGGQDAETARKDEIYREASEAMRGLKNPALQQQAIELFHQIPGWRDAEEQIAVCQQRLLALQEQEKAERAKREAQARRRKKRRWIAGAGLAACLSFAIVLHTAIRPALRYRRAEALFAAGNYAAASAAFAAMDGCRDSETKLLDCQYEIAAAHARAGEYDEALAAFALLNGYRDSAARIELCKTEKQEQQYNAAVSLLEAGAYGEAYPALLALDGYRDSAVKASEIYGAYRAALLEDPQVGDYLFFGAYEQDNDASNGPEDVEWLVLAREQDRALVISRYALDCQPYSTTKARVTWTSCNIRHWLNENFVNDAFTEEEQARIVETLITARERQDTLKTADANDKLFALDQTEIYKYFPSEASRICAPTAYAIAQGAPYRNNETEDGACSCWWWMRFQGFSNWNAPCITPSGSITHLDQYLDDAYNAVRPAMWIKVGGS